MVNVSKQDSQDSKEVPQPTQQLISYDHDLEMIDMFVNKQYLSALLILVGLGVHSIFEGLALGATKDFNVAVSLGIAIVMHKYLAAFALGMLIRCLYNVCV